MRYRLLGPVEAWRDGAAVRFTGRKQRTLLAVLLLGAGRMVPVARLFHVLWGDDLPRTARAQLHNHVSVLRKVLGVPVHGGSEGYRLPVMEGELDLAEFEGTVAAARAAVVSGDDERAVDALRVGLALWSSPVLGGVTDELRETAAHGLAERRLTALCDRIDAELRLGQHQKLVAELRDLADEHPLDDRFAQRFMLALHRSGRQADALAAFNRTQRRYRDELGLDAPQALRELHLKVLTAAPVPSPAPPSPRLTAAPLIRVLGPVTVGTPDAPVALGGAQQRGLLALLAVHLGRAVSTDQLVWMMWGDHPPPTARTTIQVYVSRLRRVLSGLPRTTIDTVGGGYRLDAPPELVDLHVFRLTVHKARDAADDEERARLLSAALAWWQGQPLAEVFGGPGLDRLAAELDEERLAAVEDRAEAVLRLGGHQDLLAELTGLVHANPLRERLVGALMTCLVRLGRRGDASAVFHELRRATTEEFGIEPGSELQRLHREILTDDDTSALPVPAQLPAQVADFVGREAEMKQLRAMLGPDGASVAMLTGSGGVGKTALALHCAHSFADWFPDGALYADLRGYGPAGPESTATVLTRFLRALGMDPDALPAATEELSALFRSVLAGKRVLVLLDNARDTTQVRALLPGSPHSRVVVTSRDNLPGLVARDGARRIEVARFSKEQSLDLFTRVLGAESTAAHPEQFDELARRCAYLPLALRLAAERLLWRPWELADLLSDLAGDTRLDLLGGEDDPDSAVRAVFSWSYRLLPAESAQLFRLLGVWPGPDVDVLTAAELLGTASRAARQAVETLARAHLVEEPTPGRVAMHDLLRAYAAELAAELEPDFPAALKSALNRHCAIATACMNLVDPYRRRVPPPDSVAARDVPTPDTAEAALAWLDTEHHNLIALTRYAASTGHLAHAWYLPHTLSRFNLRRRHIGEWIDIGLTALDAARRLADPFAEAETRTHLAAAYTNRGEVDEAISHYQHALPLHRRASNTHGEAVILGNLGAALHRVGEFDEAAAHYRQAVTLLAEVGDHRNESLIVANLAGVLNLLNRHAEAQVAAARALDLGQQTDDLGTQVHALRIIGIAHREQGHHEEASRCLEEALALARSQQDETDEGLVISEIAHLRSRQEHHQQAVDLHTQALAIARRSDDLNAIAIALLDLGEAHVASGDPHAALPLLREALDLTTRVKDRHHAERVRAALTHAEDVLRRATD